MNDLRKLRRAVVTGASSGIGLTCCEELLDGGWDVTALDRMPSPWADGAAPAGVAAAVRDGRFRAIACDVTEAAQVANAFGEVGRAGPLDALVCSAGVLRGGPLVTMTEAEYDLVFDINTRGSWLCAKAAYPLLRREQAPAEAPRRIVFVASGAAIRPKLGAGAYAASKAALVSLAKVLAVELAADGILVNAVAPATVDTPLTRALAGSKDYRVTGDSPLGRVAATTDVTSVIRFLLGQDSAYMTGAVLAVDGGTTAAFVPADRGQR